MISFPELSKPVAVYLITSPVLATSWFEVINYEEDYHDRAQRIITSIVYRWQSERDEQNEIYGDMSPYWNTPSLLEPQYDSEEELENEEEYEDN